MRAYKPIDTSHVGDVRTQPKRVTRRPQSSGPIEESVVPSEPSEVLARIPNLADVSSEPAPDDETSLSGGGRRGSRLSLKILGAGIIVLLLVAAKPLVWPLVFDSKSPTTTNTDQSSRWPTAPESGGAITPKWDGKGADSNSWQPGNVTAGKAQRVEPSSEALPGPSSPWDNPVSPPATPDPMPWRTQAGRPASTEPPDWPAPNLDRAPPSNPRQYPTTAGGPYGPSYRTATRNQFSGEPRLPARDDQRGDSINAPSFGSYPRFTNPDVRQDRSPRSDPPPYPQAPRYRYPSTDQPGQQPAAESSSWPSWGPDPGSRDAGAAADPGAARLEGYIERPNARATYERP